MAITRADCLVWRSLRKAGLIPQSPAVLEIGRANWYGDVPNEEIASDCQEFAPEKAKMVHNNAWEMADWYYRVMLRNPQRTAIDLDLNAPDCHRHNLNERINVDGAECDIAINTGTCEHVFNQGQVWKTIHDAVKVGGLMVHAMPLWGWLDHGFYNYQPTFIKDIAAENAYEILLWMFAESDPFYAVQVKEASDFQALYPRSRERSAMMHVVFRKTRSDDFKVPMQGVYSSRATPEQRQAWLNRGRVSDQQPKGDSMTGLSKELLMQQLMGLADERKTLNARLDGAEMVVRQQLQIVEKQEEELRKKNVAEADEEAKKIQAEEAAKNGSMPPAIAERIGAS